MNGQARSMSVCALLLICAACSENMDDQPKYHEWERSRLFRNGSVVQAPPEGTVDRDAPARATALATRPPTDMALLQRGQQRYDIACAPCHGATGDGGGMIVARGFPRPPSLHLPRLKAAGDAHVVDVITNGHGVMYSLADRVAPRDRWAIAAYIRALQLSQDAPVQGAPSGVQTRLEALP